MYGQQQGPQRRSGGSRAGGVIFLVIAVIAVLAWIGSHVHQQVQVTTCTQGVTWSCTQTAVPLQTQGP